MSNGKTKLLLAIFVVYFVAGMSADRLGYLMTGYSFAVRLYVLFPVMLLGWYLWLFNFRWGAQQEKRYAGKTGHQVNMERLQGKFGRIKLVLLYALLIPALLAGIAWLTIGIPAWLARFAANEPFAHEYLYTPGAFIASGYKFKDTVTGDNSSVRVTAALYKDFPDEVSTAYAGKIVCLQGRTSIFGTIVQEIKPGHCK